ncbi:hypothetical protein GCM10018966_069950 [Streptomyces yanii]
MAKEESRLRRTARRAEVTLGRADMTDMTDLNGYALSGHGAQRGVSRPQTSNVLLRSDDNKDVTNATTGPRAPANDLR